MRRIPLNEIKEGEIIAQAIYDEQGRILLKAGITMTERLKNKIVAQNILSVYITDDSDDIESLSDVISPSLRNDAIKTIKKIYTEFVTTETSRNFASGKVNMFKENPHIVALNDTVESILDEVFANKDVLVEMVDIKKMDNYLYEHAVNTAVLSLLIGLELKMREDELRRMIMAALLMDVGNNLIKQELLNKPDKLDPKEYREIQSHVEKGFEFIREHSDVPVHIRNIVLQHHERYDGSGYPKGLKGDLIDKIARIIAVADTYDALTSDRPFRPAFDPSAALEKIMSDAGKKFDFEIVNVFSKRVLAYPVGTYVKLSSGDVGEVVGSNKDIPLRPIVHILKSKHGHDGKVFDLRDELSIVIEGVVYYIDE